MIGFLAAAAMVGTPLPELPSQVPETFYAMNVLKNTAEICKPVEIRRTFAQMINSIEADPNIKAVRVVGFVDGETTVFMVSSVWNKDNGQDGILLDVFSSDLEYCKNREQFYILEYQDMAKGRYISRPTANNFTQMVFGSLLPEPPWPR